MSVLYPVPQPRPVVVARPQIVQMRDPILRRLRIPNYLR